jgi:hypothetical protein
MATKSGDWQERVAGSTADAKRENGRVQSRKSERLTLLALAVAVFITIVWLAILGYGGWWLFEHFG